MTEERFWELVRKSGWYRFWKYDRNVEICHSKLLSAVKEGELQEFDEMLSDKYGALQERIESYYKSVSKGKYSYIMPKGFSPNGFIGDDTISDGLYHIIGRGKTCYNQVMKNPNKFWTMFKDVYEMMMTESFCYVTFEKDSKFYEFDDLDNIKVDTINPEGMTHNDIIETLGELTQMSVGGWHSDVYLGVCKLFPKVYFEDSDLGERAKKVRDFSNENGGIPGGSDIDREYWELPGLIIQKAPDEYKGLIREAVYAT